MTHSLRLILKAIISHAEQFGLHEADLKQAYEFLNYNEYGLCFDSIVTQLYEFDIEVDEGFYRLLDEAAKKMHLPAESYIFITQLIKK